ncbi:tail assembly protein [Alcaligenes sp. WGS1538]|uniref:tail assembly protein n=1 Tax=Alcaligenes sp. WGS1538 TaxID=3366811 RepID=UPI00372D5F1A
MPEKIRTVRLYGVLGARFGRVHRLVCNSTAEAVSALCQMLPNFQRFLYESKDRGLGYACFIGKQNIGEDELQYPVGDEDIRIAPVILGSGRGGLFQIVLGVALIIGAPYLAGAVWGTSATLAVAIAANAPMLGWAMVLGGVSQLLTRQPQGLTSVGAADNGASYNFNGPVNTTAQGNPVPVLYGEMIVGAATISGDMYAEDQQ